MAADVTRSRIFDGLTESERRTWLEQSLSREWKRGSAVARQGEPARAFSLVESGLLKLVQLTPDGVLIAHPLTRQELAELAGTTLYTVSRTLSRWQARGWLRSERRRLLVRAPKQLVALTRGGGGQEE
jgi:CRP-like cAMP-binding protein